MGPQIVVWCNGNTTDFGSVFQGSNPCATTHGGRSLVGRALACGASCRGFESHRSHRRRVA